MDAQYRHTGKPSMRVVEECAELIKAITKAERFGYGNSHPDSYPCRARPKEDWCDSQGPGTYVRGHTCGAAKTNMDEIHEEFSDLLIAWNDMLSMQGGIGR